MIEDLEKLENEALQDIAACDSAETAEKVRIKYLGRKGSLAEFMKKMKTLPALERPRVGKAANAVKGTIARRLESRLTALAETEKQPTAPESVDVTLPGALRAIGKIHPLQQVIRRICDIFVSLGFRIIEGPEIETEYYNFEALNIPLEHPSRDAFDTFYLKNDQQAPKPDTRRRFLLRSHTSPVQARFMEKNSPPFSIVIPGKVYRPDATDASHSFMFHQVEGLTVGSDITFADLKGVLTVFSKQMFGGTTRMRFRPHFFPFTEPSAEVDISCIICSKQKPETGSRKRCSVCGGKGWLEILGAGMVNPKVFKAAGYNAKKVSGFAFGMGVERIAMLKYSIDDIRLFFENDVRFLRQF